MVLTILNVGSIVLTLFPNFNIPMKDRRLSKLLKIQVQLHKVEQTARSFVVMLHYQLAYHLHNHAVNLQILGLMTDPIFINSYCSFEKGASIIQFPIKISREELQPKKKKKIPFKWIIN